MVTCAHLLAQNGVALTGAVADVESPPAPIVLLSDAALALLRDVLGRPNLLAGLPRIERRVVAWGGAPVTVPHAGAVATGAMLATAVDPPRNGEDLETFFTIYGTTVPEIPVRRFGSRPAEAAAVHLTRRADRNACHVESVLSGWLFLIPNGEAAWLLGIGAPIDSLLAESRLVATQVASLEPAAARFETAPRMLEQLSGADWLALGTSAIAFDPICGDGTAQAAREAVLAAAVVTGLIEGGDHAALLGHYHAMLLAAMRRHLQIAVGFYSNGGTSPWWQEQAAATRAGYDWCTARLGLLPEPHFVLHGTRLIAREKAA